MQIATDKHGRVLEIWVIFKKILELQCFIDKRSPMIDIVWPGVFVGTNCGDDNLPGCCGGRQAVLEPLFLGRTQHCLGWIVGNRVGGPIVTCVEHKDFCITDCKLVINTIQWVWTRITWVVLIVAFENICLEGTRTIGVVATVLLRIATVSGQVEGR